MHETAKVLDSKLTRTCFLSNAKFLLQVKLLANYLSAYLFSAELSILNRLF